MKTIDNLELYMTPYSWRVKQGNLTKSTLEVVLAQKPPAWLQVIYERLKHLVISSETFQKKKKGYMAKGKVKLSKKLDSR